MVFPYRANFQKKSKGEKSETKQYKTNKNMQIWNTCQGSTAIFGFAKTNRVKLRWIPRVIEQLQHAMFLPG